MVMVIHEAGNESPINEFYVYLSVDKNGNEGVMGGINPKDGNAFSLTFGTEQDALQYLPIVEQIARGAGYKARLVKFSNKEVLCELG